MRQGSNEFQSDVKSFSLHYAIESLARLSISSLCTKHMIISRAATARYLRYGLEKHVRLTVTRCDQSLTLGEQAL